MNVLSLFDGMSGGQLALQKAGLKVDKYYSCEIDEYAQSVTRYNFPNTIFLGDVTKVDFSKLKDIDVVIAGSPCQDLSFAKGNGKGLEGSRSSLFYKFVEAIEVCKPEYFLLENVKMKQEWKDIISDLLGVQPIFINSADFSAQNRQRLYWTNIPIAPWTPCNDKLQDILEVFKEEDWYVNRDKAYTMTATYSGACPRDYFEKSSRQLAFTDREKSHCLDANYFKGGNLKSYFEKHRRQLVFNYNPASIVTRRIDKDGKRKDYDTTVPKVQTLEVHEKDKSRCLSTVSKDTLVSQLPEGRYPLNRCIQVGEADIKGHESMRRVYSPEGKSPALNTCGGGNREPKVYEPPLQWRKLTPIECERLQTVPDNYTSKGIRDGKEVKISNTQRYKMLGNGWTIDVIAHIFESLRKGAV